LGKDEVALIGAQAGAVPVHGEEPEIEVARDAAGQRSQPIHLFVQLLLFLLQLLQTLVELFVLLLQLAQPLLAGVGWWRLLCARRGWQYEQPDQEPGDAPPRGGRDSKCRCAAPAAPDRRSGSS